MNTIGHNIKITFFGESHGSHIGVVIDNLPPGLKIDEELIKFNLTKRRPVKNINTTRVETDSYQIISGFFNGYTTGGALTVLVKNSNTLSADYKNLENIPRPSHADYPAHVKYQGYNDFRGGGFFSGRLTALWMIVGAISEQLLAKYNVVVGSHIYQIKDVKDTPFKMNETNKKQLNKLNKSIFPLIDEKKHEKMEELIINAKKSLDSVGGIVESKVINLPIGVGEPYFLSVESYLSQLLFSVPAVKAIEFGKGFEFTNHFGSEMNDQYEVVNKKVSLLSNNNGGILGGLTTGAPIIVRVVLKPTSSISKKQQSVDLNRLENTELIIKGRHDPQIVSRAVHVVNSVINFGVLDLIMFQSKKEVST